MLFAGFKKKLRAKTATGNNTTNVHWLIDLIFDPDALNCL